MEGREKEVDYQMIRRLATYSAALSACGIGLCACGELELKPRIFQTPEYELVVPKPLRMRYELDNVPVIVEDIGQTGSLQLQRVRYLGPPSLVDSRKMVETMTKRTWDDLRKLYRDKSLQPEWIEFGPHQFYAVRRSPSKTTESIDGYLLVNEILIRASLDMPAAGAADPEGLRSKLLKAAHSIRQRTEEKSVSKT